MKIKVCGLKYINNIKPIIQQSPDYIGFIFYKGSKRYIGDQHHLSSFISTIKEVKKVGVFVNETSENIISYIKEYDLDLIQLHGNETPDDCEKIRKYFPVIKSFPFASSFDFNILKNYLDACDYFLFDAPSKKYGGSGRPFDWKLLNNYTLEKGFFLSGGIGLENANELKQLRHTSLIGVDINSKFEIAPGLKNINKIKSFIHEIRN